MQVAIYPNPAQDMVTIRVDGLTSDAEVTIFDMQGKVVGRYKMLSGDNTLSLNVSTMTEGSYLVRISSNGENRVERMIIKK